MPPLDASIRPIAREPGLRHAVAGVAEQLDSRRAASGSAPQLTATNGRPRRGPSRWSRRATSSLPVPVSPSTSTSTSAAATWRIVSRSRDHRRAVADQAVAPSAASPRPRAAGDCRAPAAASPARARTAAIRWSVGERLGQEIEGAVLQRLDRHRHVAMAGDQDHRQLRVDRAQPAEAAAARPCAACGCRRRRRRRSRRSIAASAVAASAKAVDLEAGELQRLAGRGAQRVVVVDEDTRPEGSSTKHASCAPAASSVKAAPPVRGRLEPQLAAELAGDVARDAEPEARARPACR